MMSNVRKVLLTYKNEKTIKKQRYMETSIQNVPGRCFDEVQLFRFIPSGVSVSVWRSNSSLRFFSTLGHSHGFSLSLSPPGLLQSGRTGRSGLQQACPASSFRCLSNVCPSKCGECSLFPLHTVAHISCKKSDRLDFWTCMLLNLWCCIVVRCFCSWRCCMSWSLYSICTNGCCKGCFLSWWEGLEWISWRGRTDFSDCVIVWTILEGGWGWLSQVARCVEGRQVLLGNSWKAGKAGMECDH